ncbi:MAG: hypothetical protein ACRCWG_13455 [Sarcina sp.]
MKEISVNNKVYEIVKLLGKGKGGYSYLAVNSGDEYVLKQIHHEPCEYYEFGDKFGSELRDYGILSKLSIKLPKLIDYDVEKEIIIKEYIDGPTVAELVESKSLNKFYIDEMKKISSILKGEEINIDYYPTNFIISNNEIFYIDYECNKYMDEWSFENWGIQYWKSN